MKKKSLFLLNVICRISAYKDVSEKKDEKKWKIIKKSGDIFAFFVIKRWEYNKDLLIIHHKLFKKMKKLTNFNESEMKAFAEEALNNNELFVITGGGPGDEEDMLIIDPPV